MNTYAAPIGGIPIMMRLSLSTLVTLALCTACSGSSGTKGDTGPAGPAGPAGATGPAGAAGPTGPAGAAGAAGAIGAQGPAGLPIVTAGGNQITVNGIFCGASGATTGNFSDPTGGTAKGYRAAKLACQQVASCGSSATAHMCDAGEMVRSAQVGALVIPSNVSSVNYWVSTGVYAYYGPSNTAAADCNGWGDGTVNTDGATFVLGSGGGIAPTLVSCVSSYAIACCK